MDIFEVPEDDEGLVRFELVDDSVVEGEVLGEGLGDDVLGLGALVCWLELDLADLFAFAIEVAEALDLLDDIGKVGGVLLVGLRQHVEVVLVDVNSLIRLERFLHERVHVLEKAKQVLLVIGAGARSPTLLLTHRVAGRPHRLAWPC